ncbi:MAG TPA: hypothetical protein VK207_03385 [Bacteroidales bacterium]|jgi:divalent metal cation (Fe/Co/Zn/Cd) transporter|nr:hypothetical protein [Bacteroidales bacterium]
MYKGFNLLKRPLSLWLVSIVLFAVSLEGILSFPGLMKSSQTTMEYAVIVSQGLYALAGIVIIAGLWFSLRATPLIVILWGIFSLGAALGGPLFFSHVKPTFPRTAIIMTLAVFFITAALFLYTRYIINKQNTLRKADIV